MLQMLLVKVRRLRDAEPLLGSAAVIPGESKCRFCAVYRAHALFVRYRRSLLLQMLLARRGEVRRFTCLLYSDASLVARARKQHLQG